MSKSSCVVHVIRATWHGGICMSRQLGWISSRELKEHLLVAPRAAVLVVVLAEAAELNLPEPENWSVSDAGWTVKFFTVTSIISKNCFQIQSQNTCFSKFSWGCMPHKKESILCMHWVHFVHCVCTLMYLNYPLCHCFSRAPLKFFALLPPCLAAKSIYVGIVWVPSISTVDNVMAYMQLKESVDMISQHSFFLHEEGREEEPD